MIEVPDDFDDLVRYGKPAVNRLFDWWAGVMGYTISSNVQKNRWAVERLLKKHGEDKVKEFVLGAREARKDRYAPQISSFIDLDFKWDKLTEWAIRHSQKDDEVIDI